MATKAGKEKVCPFWIKETYEEVGRPEPTRRAVTHCIATGRMVCIRDYSKYELCEFFQQFRKSHKENTPVSMNRPRYPIPSPD